MSVQHVGLIGSIIRVGRWSDLWLKLSNGYPENDTDNTNDTINSNEQKMKHNNIARNPDTHQTISNTSKTFGSDSLERQSNLSPLQGNCPVSLSLSSTQSLALTLLS